MPKRRPLLPTDAELEVLRVLWTRGPSTAREVHEQLRSEKDTGYTTTLRLLQNLHAKALTVRDESQRQHVYHPAVEEESTLRAVVGRLVDRLFGGSGVALAVRALGATGASIRELDELKQLIQRLEDASGGEPASGERAGGVGTGREEHAAGDRDGSAQPEATPVRTVEVRQMWRKRGRGNRFRGGER